MAEKQRIKGNGTIEFREISSDQQDSIEISGPNSKGGYPFKVKVYDDDPDGMESKLKTYLQIAQLSVEELEAK